MEDVLTSPRMVKMVRTLEGEGNVPYSAVAQLPEFRISHFRANLRRYVITSGEKRNNP